MSVQGQIKICGVTRIDDIRVALDAGATAIGVNLWPGSSRCVDQSLARELVEYCGDAALRVAVVVDHPLADCQALLRDLPFDFIQLHGSEPISYVEALLPRAFKAFRVRGEAEVAAAKDTPGDIVLVDSHVEGVVGGSGHAFDWTLAAPLAAERRVLLAGGLYAGNVATAIDQVRPWGVDVCSGVEAKGAPRRKDAAEIRAFCAAAQTAFEAL